MNRKRYASIIFPIVIVAMIVAIGLLRGGKENVYQHDSGFVFGTIYNITYECADNHKTGIEAVLKEVDNSLSPFNDSSIITAINKNVDVEVDKKFEEVYNLARLVHDNTDGAFDITVAPLVNAWGFGFKSGNMPSANEVDSLKKLIGLEKTSLANKHVKKADPRIMLDCSAIAKGYGVDVVARYLDSIGVENYMVEIGGEVVVKGHNDSGKAWRIGVTKPTDDSLAADQEIQTVLSLTNTAMATSGNYRNFYYKGGRKYAHTIDPKTGYPVQHNILSATVIANSCAKADAYATSFMVMGLEKARKVLQKQKDLKAYFIYSDSKGNNAVWMSPELEADIAK